MKLITEEQRSRMLRNGQQNAEACGSLDFAPVVKLFTPDAGCTWLLTELDPEDEDIAFGLCDLGLGYPELGSVRLSEIAGIRGRLGLPVERDLSFEARHPISVYARAAHSVSGITEETKTLMTAAAALAAEVRS